MRRSRWLVLVSTGLLIWVTLHVVRGEPEKAPRTVAKVVDGDTVRLTDGESVRLLGIDTPERGEPLYREATEALAFLVSRRDVRLEFAGNRRDHYKRLLAHLWLSDTLVSEQMVRTGMARVYIWPPDTLHYGRLLAAQTEARRIGVGIWSLPPPAAEVHYVVHPERLRFHRPSCRSAPRRAERRHVTRDVLLDSGYSACRTCKP
jgi:endonuclease YncB( thermonuclease family)